MKESEYIKSLEEPINQYLEDHEDPKIVLMPYYGPEDEFKHLKTELKCSQTGFKSEHWFKNLQSQEDTSYSEWVENFRSNFSEVDIDYFEHVERDDVVGSLWRDIIGMMNGLKLEKEELSSQIEVEDAGENLWSIENYLETQKDLGPTASIIGSSSEFSYYFEGTDKEFLEDTYPEMVGSLRNSFDEDQLTYVCAEDIRRIYGR